MLKDSIVQMDGCCERTATGNATAMPASSLMNSRRLMHDPPCGRLGFLFAGIFHAKQLRPRHSPFDPRSTLLVCNSPTAPRSLGDPLWDTSSPQGRLLSTLLAAIAEFERELIRERTGEGRRRAMANGVKFGRKPKLSPYQRAEAIKRRAAGETLASIARSYAVDLSMISRL
jgi:Resolvase, N terminal domain